MQSSLGMQLYFVIFVVLTVYDQCLNHPIHDCAYK